MSSLTDESDEEEGSGALDVKEAASALAGRELCADDGRGTSDELRYELAEPAELLRLSCWGSTSTLR